MNAHEPHEQTLVLRDDANYDDLASHAEGNGWNVSYTGPYSHHEYRQVLWVTNEVHIRYLELHTTGTRFVSVYGSDQDKVDAAVSDVVTTVGTVSTSELLDALLADDEPAPVEIVRDFRRLAAAHHVMRVHNHAAPPLDPRYLEAVTRHIAHPHRQVRLTVMLVADELSTLWREITDPIVARKGVEEEHAELIEAFVDVAESRG